MGVVEELVLKPLSTLFSFKLHVYSEWLGESRDCGNSKSGQSSHPGCPLGPRFPEAAPPLLACSLSPI